ncbi:MAG TPA: lysine--tRNA ligase [Candidatus Peribacterales bacterium]|nr:lysine--tRNA ligase [Candidatus Peribacterales bacterium]
MPEKNLQHREYIKQIHFEDVAARAAEFAEFIERNREKIVKTLLMYETYEVASDEIRRSVDLLISLRENSEYFQREVGPVASFLPSNQPLYATTCFTVVPSLMASESHVKAPEGMRKFFPALVQDLELKKHFPNVHVHQGARADFIDKRAARRIHPKTRELETATDAVIFTGTPEKASLVRNEFHQRVLFIINGAGHNPMVVAESADIERAIASALRLQLYNQGQDCSAPNAILVHTSVYDVFVHRLAEQVRQVKVGSYQNRENTVGPISRDGDLPRIQGFLEENGRYISAATEGIIRTRSGIVEPTIIEKPLQDGGNFTEQFAPIFFIQRYEGDDELGRYFEDPKYKANAMYITLFGNSPYVESLIGDPENDKNILHDVSTIIRNTDLHAPGVERGTKPYGGYGRGASSISIHGRIIAKPTLPQRDIYEFLVKPSLEIAEKKEEEPKKQIHEISRVNTEDREHWGSRIVDSILKKFPDKEEYTVAAGASPYRTIHFGCMRDVMTAFAIVRELQEREKNARFVFSWDDLDGLRELPTGLNPSWEKYVGMPLSQIPDPFGKTTSYARHFEEEFEQAMEKLGMNLTFSSQTERYKSGEYDAWILDALRRREQYAEMMLRHMSPKTMTRRMIQPEKYRQDYYPVSIYSRFTGKSNTSILNFDGDKNIMYRCLDTGNEETVDLTRERIAKLKWRAEWPIRWKAHGIVFEAGGVAESARGGSHEVAQAISKEMLGNQTPIYQQYGTVRLREGSTERHAHELLGGLSINKLLEIYEPRVLQWMYLRRSPLHDLNISFDTDVIRQYDEYDRDSQSQMAKQCSATKKALLWAGGLPSEDALPAMPFRQAVALGQTVGWDTGKLSELLASIEMKYDQQSIDRRLPRARSWVEKYNSEKAISLLEKPNKPYAETMDAESITNIRNLRAALSQETLEVAELKTIIMLKADAELTSETNKERQRAFRTNVYRLLFGKDSGPRLATFLWAADRQKVLQLLDI